MPVLPTSSLAATFSLALLGASCSLTTDLSGLQKGAGGGSMTTTTSSSGSPVCRDGIIQVGEECDDGNSSPNDGCADCVVECDDVGEFKDPETFHCYWHDGATSLDFENAKGACASWRKNGTLVAIPSSKELTFLTVAHTTKQGTWIGATDLISSGNYQWVTGEPWDSANWASGSPDNSGGFARCVVFGENSLGWRCEPCFNSNLLFCESSPLGEPAP